MSKLDILSFNHKRNLFPFKIIYPDGRVRGFETYENMEFYFNNFTKKKYGKIKL